MTRFRLLVMLGGTLGVSGCAVLSGQLPTGLSSQGDPIAHSKTITERAEAASDATRVSNPPAQHIRFDGQEKLLGGGTCESIPASELLAQVRDLQEQQKIRSAKLVVQMHQRAAQRLLLEHTDKPNQAALDLIASTLDEAASSTLWSDLLLAYREQPEAAARWHSMIHTLLTANDHLESAEEKVAELAELAAQLNSPLPRIKSLQLNGDLQVAGEQTSAGIESLATAAEMAAEIGSPSLASELWLMACEASLQADAIEQARRCWRAAVSSQLTSLHTRGPSQPLPTIDPVFWEQAERLAHPSDQLPRELTLALAPWYSRIGIQVDQSLSPKVALWAAIADFQLATGQPHVASLSIKKAETDASEALRPFLQIALARAMAAQGQHSVATTIIGKEAESDNPNVRASALAVMGAIKIQSGVYEQGSRFLSQALAIDEASQWPGRLAAKADLANVRLILGHLDEVLPALHQVQMEMLTSQKWQSLCHSLENEASILELEGRIKEAKEIRERVSEMELRINEDP